jgi:hypothetical protein
MTAFLVDNEVHSRTSLTGKSQAFDALRHQYVAELLRREKIFTETFIPDGSHPSGQRTLGQIEHPSEIKSNSEDDSRVLVDIDESGASQPLLSARDLAGGDSIGLGQVDGSGPRRSKAATVGRSSCPVEYCLGSHEGIADAPKVNTPVRLGLVGPSRNQIEFASSQRQTGCPSPSRRNSTMMSRIFPSMIA